MIPYLPKLQSDTNGRVFQTFSHKDTIFLLNSSSEEEKVGLNMNKHKRFVSLMRLLHLQWR